MHHLRCNSNICNCCSLRLKQRRATEPEGAPPFEDRPSVGAPRRWSPGGECRPNPGMLVLLSSLSTVLAQDHFYSDFLSLHVTLKTPISTRRMRCNCLPTRRVPQGLPCRVDDSLGMQSADWCTHKFDAALGACGEGVCTGQQPSCQVTVCGIKRGAVRIVPAWHAGSFML